MVDVHMESPAPTPSRPLGRGGGDVATSSARKTTDAPSAAEERREQGDGVVTATGFDYFDALDVELERRILRQLSHEVSRGTGAGDADVVRSHPTRRATNAIALELPYLVTPPPFLFSLCFRARARHTFICFLFFSGRQMVVIWYRQPARHASPRGTFMLAR